MLLVGGAVSSGGAGAPGPFGLLLVVATLSASGGQGRSGGVVDSHVGAAPSLVAPVDIGMDRGARRGGVLEQIELATSLWSVGEPGQLVEYSAHPLERFPGREVGS